MMVVLGPVLVAAAASSRLLTIFSGNAFACANVLPVFIGGGALFVTGIITCLVGVIMPGPYTRPPPPLSTTAATPTGQGTCRECGRVNAFGLFARPVGGEAAA